MRDGKQAIRNLVAAWLDAVAAGDLPKLLGLRAEGVVFLVPGQPPMCGRDAFAVAFQTGLQHHRIVHIRISALGDTIIRDSALPHLSLHRLDETIIVVCPRSVP